MSPEKDFIIRQLLGDVMQLKLENASLKYVNSVQKEELEHARKEADTDIQSTEADLAVTDTVNA